MKPLDYLKDLTILYAEDDILARDEVVFSLEPYVKRVVTVGDGSEGVKKFEDISPDIVVTDIQMPKMNGIEMAQAIRKIDPEVPIVVTTAFNDSDYLLKAIDANITAYITKPLDLRQLIDKLAQIAGRHVMEQENRRMHRMLEQYQLAIDESTYIVNLSIDLETIHINDRLCELLCLRPENILGKHIFALLEPENEEERIGFKTAADEEREWHGEMVMGKSCEEQKYFRVTMIPMRNYADERVRFTLFMQDITELIRYRQLLQKELSATRRSLNENINYLAQYQQILDEATAICCFDPDGTIKRSDANFNKTIGADENELLGQSFFDLCSGVRDDIRAAIETAKESRALVHLQTRCKKEPEAKERIAHSVFKPIFTLDGKIEEIVSIHQDITELIELNEEIKSTQKEILFRLGEVAENHSKETGLHVRRVAEYSRILAELIGMEEEEREILYAAAPMHDIGKLTIPDHILHKPARLTPEEFEVMKEHTTKGAQMFANSERPFMKAAAIIAAQHHENFDGSGYPSGLDGENIHIYGRIVALADVFDALSVERVYKSAWPIDKILNFMRENRGVKFDPLLIDLFFENIDRFLQIHNTYRER